MADSQDDAQKGGLIEAQRERKVAEHSELFAWCVEHIPKFPPREGRWVDDITYRLSELYDLPRVDRGCEPTEVRRLNLIVDELASTLSKWTKQEPIVERRIAEKTVHTRPWPVVGGGPDVAGVEAVGRAEACDRCQTRAAREPHTCPYKEEINDDHVSLCNCCQDCRDDCCMEI